MRNHASVTFAAATIAEDTEFHCPIGAGDDEFGARVGHRTSGPLVCYIDGTPAEMRAAGERLIALADEVERGDHAEPIS